MAISKDQLTVSVELDSSGAVKGFKDLQGQIVEFDQVIKSSGTSTTKASEQTSKLGSMVDGLSGTLSKAALPLLAIQTAVSAVTQVFSALSSTLGDFVNDYAEAEKAQTLLTQAIENAGGRIKNTGDAWGEYLDALQEVKAVDADVLRGLVAQAVQMGFSEQQIKSLVEASIGLSKVTGDGLDSSFQKLIGTTKGMARGLAAMIPELQNLTDEQLKSGDAFAIVAEKYGKAADGAGSYTYSMKQAKLAAGELSEDIGKLIVETFNLKGAIDTGTTVINGIRNAIANVDMDALTKSFKEFISVAGPIALVVGAAVAGFTGLTAAVTAAAAPVILVTAKITLIAAAIAGAVAALEILVRNIGLFDEALAIIANSIGVLFLKPLENAAWSLREFLSLFGDNALSKAADQVFKGIEKSVNSLKDNVSKNFTSIKTNIDTGFSGQIVKQATNFVEGFTKETDKANVSLKNLGDTGARVKVIDEKAVEAAKTALKDITNQTNQLKLATSLAGADEITQIKEKAAEQLKGIDLKRTELTEQGLLNAQLKAALNDQRDAVIANRDKLIVLEQQKTQMDEQKKLNDELKNVTDGISKSYDQSRLANLGTFEIIQQQAAAELEKITTLEKQLELAGGLTAEKKAEIEATKAAIAEMQSEKTGQAIMSGVTSALGAAQGGADALLGNVINQVGAAFGPQGQMIAGAVNLLRQGKDFTKQLGQDIIGIIADLPQMLTDGLIGLIEGLVDGLMKLLGDPKAIMKFINSIVTAVPKIISALVAGLPQIAIAMSKPSFWITVIKGFVIAFIDGQKEMFKALGDGFAALGDGLVEIFEDAVAVFSDIGDSLMEGFEEAWNWLSDAITGIGDALADGFMDAINGIGDFFGSIGTMIWDGISWVFNEIGSFFSGLFEFDGGGTGVVEDFLGFDFPWIAFAEGGKVPGTPKVFGDSTKNDTVAALLSPGEYVIPRSKMQDPMNLMMIDAIMSGGMMRDWIEQGMSGGVQTKSYGEWIEKASSGGLEFHGFWDDVGDAIAGGAEAVIDTVVAAGDVIAEGFSKVGDFVMPDWLVGIWDSIKQFISTLDLGELITDPAGYLEKMIKNFSDFLVEPAKKMMGFADGGLVPGNGSYDSVPAMLTPGEFVINKSAVNGLGAGLLNQLNAGRMGMGDSAPVFNINLNIETKDALDAGFIRNTLIPTIKSELKASSLRGDFVLSAKGVRG